MMAHGEHLVNGNFLDYFVVVGFFSLEFVEYFKKEI